MHVSPLIVALLFGRSEHGAVAHPSHYRIVAMGFLVLLTLAGQADAQNIPPFSAVANPFATAAWVPATRAGASNCSPAYPPFPII